MTRISVGNKQQKVSGTYTDFDLSSAVSPVLNESPQSPKPPKLSKKPSNAGFTLLELLVVLSIIIIATSLVMPSITSTTTNTFRAEVRNAASALNYARRIAIVDSSPKTAFFMVFDPEDPDYLERKEALGADEDIPFWESLDISLTYQTDVNDLEEEVDLIEVIFFPQGGSTGGVINFNQENLTAAIFVDPITGRVSTSYFGEEFEETRF